MIASTAALIALGLNIGNSVTIDRLAWRVAKARFKTVQAAGWADPRMGKTFCDKPATLLHYSDPIKHISEGLPQLVFSPFLYGFVKRGKPPKSIILSILLTETGCGSRTTAANDWLLVAFL